MHRSTGITHRRQFVRSAEGTVPSLSPDVAKRLENQLQANFGFWKEAPRERWLEYGWGVQLHVLNVEQCGHLQHGIELTCRLQRFCLTRTTSVSS